MNFSSGFFTGLVILALIGVSIGAVTLIVLLINDFRRKQVW